MTIIEHELFLVGLEDDTDEQNDTGHIFFTVLINEQEFFVKVKFSIGYNVKSSPGSYWVPPSREITFSGVEFDFNDINFLKEEKDQIKDKVKLNSYTIGMRKLIVKRCEEIQNDPYEFFDIREYHG
ncbi:hypothetical protein [Flammeovirga kamogawensis]|uniref:Uncharacterized protein n=1 Tax=Flammeovirga kamogawensis TaxID=373891 RepID=A0ABX8H555_9BACT|nr:hypothetical protein [Flammeovirga kamogawensis]MBB6463844.1 putative membrane protein [Flammeovirga kamogawensis]QWG10769.1 hypothetical protein KM029_26785 [Flammeovirga kamogawensis]TRX63245.1 hypothetical protein EO216_26690 [Flammeovirga kamogawensis]